MNNNKLQSCNIKIPLETLMHLLLTIAKGNFYIRSSTIVDKKPTELSIFNCESIEWIIYNVKDDRVTSCKESIYIFLVNFINDPKRNYKYFCENHEFLMDEKSEEPKLLLN